MWQATGRSDITDFEEVLALDLEYIDKKRIDRGFKRNETPGSADAI